MFTSGSTGRPKGVSFSSYNLTAKRFARAAVLRDERDRAVFSRMIFPYLELDHRLDVVVEGGEGAERVVVRSFLTDRRGETYTFNETTDPADIGRLYRLFYKENFPKVILSRTVTSSFRTARIALSGGCATGSCPGPSYSSTRSPSPPGSRRAAWAGRWWMISAGGWPARATRPF